MPRHLAKRAQFFTLVVLLTGGCAHVPQATGSIPPTYEQTLALLERSLQQDVITVSLNHAIALQNRPVDLNNVDLVERTNRALGELEKKSLQHLQNYRDRHQLLGALLLAEQLVRAQMSSGVAHQALSDSQIQAQNYYQSAAANLEQSHHAGSAALSWAVAERAGIKVGSEKITQLWDRFTQEICFAEPQIEIVDKTTQGAALLGSLKDSVQKQLDSLRQQCGKGSRPLNVRMELTQVDWLDKDQKTKAPYPLAGFSLPPDEIYWVDEPYTVDEEVVEYETHLEKQERRDCAPRPGKDRGCVTWFEDVEVKVPLKKTRTVTKTRKVEKKRISTKVVPADQVVYYEKQSVERKIICIGAVQLAGTKLEGQPFFVRVQSEDTAHASINTPNLDVPEDPMTAESMEILVRKAAEGISKEVEKSLHKLVEQWAELYALTASEKSRQGAIADSEQLYLQILALGIHNNPAANYFFEQHYGTSAATLFGILAQSLGRAMPPTTAAADLPTRLFPQRQHEDSEQTMSITPQGKPPADEASKNGHGNSLSAEELEKLEKESQQP